MATKSWLAQLQDNGYRLTVAGRAVVEIIAASQRALIPVEVYDATVIYILRSNRYCLSNA